MPSHTRAWGERKNQKYWFVFIWGSMQGNSWENLADWTTNYLKFQYLLLELPLCPYQVLSHSVFCLWCNDNHFPSLEKRKTHKTMPNSSQLNVFCSGCWSTQQWGRRWSSICVGQGDGLGTKTTNHLHPQPQLVTLETDVLGHGGHWVRNWMLEQSTSTVYP